MVPYYQRTLDSFSDEIITRVSYYAGGSGCWYACLDVGPKSWPSDPDFSTGGATKEEAIKRCAQTIRDDARGIGKYAPHSILQEGYDLRFRLMRHWASKEINTGDNSDPVV